MITSPSRRAVATFLAAAAAMLPLHGARAEAPVVFVVPQAAGGTGDTVSRLVAQRLATRLGQTVIVDNKPGAGGTMGSAFVARAAADSKTLLLVSNGFATWSVMYPALAFNPSTDLTPVAMMGSLPYTLLVRADAPFKTVPELLAFARANPGKLSYASAGVGSLSHLLSAWLKAETRIDAVHIPYTSTAPALAAVMGGQVDLYFDPVTTSVPAVRAGKVRALATTGEQRSPLLPELPTLTELGYPVAGSVWLGVATAGSAPAGFVASMNREINAVLRAPETQQQLISRGVTPLVVTPAEMKDFLAEQTKVWTKLVRDNDIKPQ